MLCLSKLEMIDIEDAESNGIFVFKMQICLSALKLR